MGEGSASELMHVAVGWPLSHHVGLSVGCLSVPTEQEPSISAGQPFGMASSRVSDERQKVWGLNSTWTPQLDLALHSTTFTTLCS